MKRLLFGLVFLIIIIVGALGLLTMTEPGLLWIYGRAGPFIPGELAIDGLHGRLVGPIGVQGVRYRSPQVDLELQRGSVNWDPVELFFKRVRITECSLSGLRIELKEATDGAKKKPAGRRDDIHLPLAADLERASITDITMVRPGSAPPMVIHEIRLQAKTRGDSLNIDALKLDADRFQISASGRIDIKANFPADLRVDWAVQPEGFNPMTGGGTLAGSMTKLDVLQNMKTPLSATLKATAVDLLTAPRWEAHLKIDPASLQTLRPAWPPVTIDGQIQGTGAGKDIALAGSLGAWEAAYGRFSGDFSLHGKGEAWQVEKLAVSLPEDHGRITMEGAATLSKGKIAVDARGNWESISWPLKGKEPQIASPTGTFTITGSPESYDIALETTVEGPQIPRGRWAVKGSGNLAALELTAVEGALLDGNLQGSGQVAWKPQLSWKADLEGEGLNPGAFWPRWPGRLSGAASTTGAMTANRPRMSLKLDHLKGALRDYPFEASALGERDGSLYRFSGVTVTSGSSELQASGSLNDAWDLTWQLNTPSLKEIFPDGSGAIKARGTVTGVRQMPTITMALQGSEIQMGTTAIGDLQTDLSLDLQDRESSRIDLKARALVIGNHPVETLTLQGRGKLADHQLTLKAASAEEAIDLAVQGDYHERSWQGTLEDAYLASVKLGVWDLVNPAGITISPERAATEELCWTSAEAGVCLEGNWRKGDELEGRVSMTQAPLALLEPILPPALTLSGYLNGKGVIHVADGGAVSGEAMVETASGKLVYTPGTQEPVNLKIGEGRVKSRLENSGLSSNFHVSLGDTGEISGDVIILPFTPFDRPLEEKKITGSLGAHVPDLGVLAVLFPEIDTTAGLFKADMALSGSLAKPMVTGSAVIEEGSARISRLGIHLQDIRLSAASAGPEGLHLDGELRSGTGVMKIKGAVDLNPREGFPSRFTLTGDNLEFVNLPEAWAIASPDLAIVLQKNKIEMTGTIVIPEARIERLDLSTGVPVSRDVVIMDTGSPPESKKQRQIFTDVRVTLGEKVHFSGFGLSGNITGSLQALDRPEKFTTGQGELQVVDGKYKAYGQNLTIERGRLVFTGGPIDDPGLDVQALRKTGEIVSGVNVRGTLKDPQMELFSSPSLEQTDALSYLVLGRSADQASGAEGALLYDAALSLGVSGGGMLAEKIGSTFGLGEIEIAQEGQAEEATLFIGKYLSPRLYVSYGIGLFEPISTLRLRYQLSTKWLVQTEYGIESGADLIYSIERD